LEEKKTLKIEINIYFAVIFTIILGIHLIILFFQNLPQKAELSSSKPDRSTPLKIRKIGETNVKSQNDVFLNKSAHKNQGFSTPTKQKQKISSLQDLNPISDEVPQKETAIRSSTQRPGTIPTSRPKAIAGIGLKGNQLRKFMEGNSKGVSFDDNSNTLSNTDVAVNLEVPEGVSPDELNKYELMFYSFQRRTAINYINSFYKNLDEFRRSNPHLQFPMTDNKQIMTGRLTYDDKGNIKQIKMVRWTNVQKLQDFFLEVLKDMDTLHNPPQALWKDSGEFSIYFSFIVNG
jgi:hypothetical protein